MTGGIDGGGAPRDERPGERSGEPGEPGEPGADTGDPTADEPRRAFVLGAGGVIGFAWLLGALSALQDTAGVDPGAAQLIIGTSAGSVAASLLSCGLPLDVIARHHQAAPAPDDPPIDYDYASTGGAYPPLPGWRPASPRLLLTQLQRPRRISPMIAASGMLPSGRGTLAPVRRLVGEVATRSGLAHDEWPDAPTPWIVAADYAHGRRIVFGREPRRDLSGNARVARRASLAEAVTASCSIPAWYPPVVIGGVPYVDGGTLSNTSADLLIHTDVDEVYLLAPMASVQADRPRHPLGRAERWARRLITRGVLADVQRLRAAGKRVCLLTPGPHDLAVMGVNLMDPRRRVEVLATARRRTVAQLERQRPMFTTWRPAPPTAGLVQSAATSARS